MKLSGELKFLGGAPPAVLHNLALSHEKAGDLEEALNAASAIGDDRLQQQSRGRVVPESFTHGTSAERQRWFRRGFERGDPAACDTFSAATLLGRALVEDGAKIARKAHHSR